MAKKSAPPQAPSTPLAVNAAKSSVPVAVVKVPSKPAPKTAASKAPVKPAINKQPAAKPTVKTVTKPAVKPVEEKPKLEKVKMVRDSFTIPKDEYAQIATLKKRLEGLSKPAKKSELLRAGLRLLATMNDQTLLTSLAAIPTIKTGRPKK